MNKKTAFIEEENRIEAKLRDYFELHDKPNDVLTYRNNTAYSLLKFFELLIKIDQSNQIKDSANNKTLYKSR